MCSIKFSISNFLFTPMLCLVLPLSCENTIAHEEKSANFSAITYQPTIQIQVGPYNCSRSWLTNQDAKILKENLLELVNIRNLTYPKFRSLYKSCRDNSSDNICHLIYQSPYFLHWAFPSILICHFESDPTNLVIRLYISVETILTKTRSPKDPISHLHLH